ncbi:MAG: hypothetical protein ACFBSD_13730 [Paracoccaceae bacterium]
MLVNSARWLAPAAIICALSTAHRPAEAAILGDNILVDTEILGLDLAPIPIVGDIVSGVTLNVYNTGNTVAGE